MATGPIETHLHRSFNWENGAPGPQEGPRGRSANCGNGLFAQCVRLRSEINHIHASSIKALQDKTRAINSSTGSGRPRLNILRTNILIGALDKGVHAIFPRCFDRNARRGHIGKVSGAIARQPNSPRTDLRILGWILPANFVALSIAPENSTNAIDGPCARCHSAAAV